MSEGRTRGAPAARTGGGRTGGGQQTERWGGSSGGRDRMARERENSENRRNQPFAPFRFYLDKGGVSEITILDDITNLDDIWFMWEHAIPGPRMDWSKTVHEVCPKEWEDCPICAAHSDDPKGRFGNSVYEMALSVVEDLGRRVNGDGSAAKPYTDKQNVVHWSGKRELIMKPTQAEAYERLFEVVIKKHGTLRGLTLRIERGRGDQASRVGNPVIMDSGEMYEILSEEQMDEFYGNDAVRDEKGVVVKAENDNITAYDYALIHPKPSAEAILDRWPNLSAASGSQADIDRTLADGESRGRGRGGADREVRRSAREEPQGTTGARGRGRSAAPATDEDQDPPAEEETQQERQPPARGRAPASAPPARGRTAAPPAAAAPAGRSRGTAPTIDGTARRVAAAPAGRAAPRGRTAAPSVDDDIPY